MYLPDSSQHSVRFNWSSSFSTLCLDRYHITASNCGNCSTHSTDSDNIVCTNIQTKYSICNFSIWFKLCANVTIKTDTEIPLGQKLESRSVLVPALLSAIIALIITLIAIVIFIWMFCKKTKMLKFETFTLQ